MKKLLIRCPIKSRSGYGSHSRDIVKALYEMNMFDIYIDSCNWGETPLNALDLNDGFDKWINSRCVTSFSGTPDVYIQITVPNEFIRVGKFNIGVTAGIETDTIHKDWVDGCNRMDLILTTSELSKQTLEKTIYNKLDFNTKQVLESYKVNKPIKVLFEGVDIKTFNNKYNGLKLDIKEDFAFLIVGNWIKGIFGEDRKNIAQTLKLFFESFKDYKNKPALVLKTSSATFSVIEREKIKNNIRLLASDYENPCPVYLLYGDLTNEEMNDLYNHPKIKSMILLSKGEGFGRPLLEFSLSGKPIIASAWGGHRDFLSPETSALVSGELKDVDKSALNDYIIEGSKWFSVDLTQSSLAMRTVYENYENYLIKSEKLRTENLYKFNYNRMKEELEIILKRYIIGLPRELNFN